tara:strand:+ start:108 stop:1004 length:897 start_codon:yes stop_codon:yes gene_type:complete
MGYLDKSTKTVTAHFTKKGRELLANAIAGDTSGDYIITQYALGDDEIDYSLYDETLSTNLMGRVIENAPILESFLSEQEIMNFYIQKITPPTLQQSTVSNIPAQIELKGQGDIVDIEPFTENSIGTEEYEFVLEHDNLVEMYSVDSPPTANFTYSVFEEVSKIIAPNDIIKDPTIKDTPKEKKQVSATNFEQEVLVKNEIQKEKGKQKDLVDTKTKDAIDKSEVKPEEEIKSDSKEFVSEEEVVNTPVDKQVEILQENENLKQISDTDREIIEEEELIRVKEEVKTYPPLANFNWFEI